MPFVYLANCNSWHLVQSVTPPPEISIPEWQNSGLQSRFRIGNLSSQDLVHAIRLWEPGTAVWVRSIWPGWSLCFLFGQVLPKDHSLPERLLETHLHKSCMHLLKDVELLLEEACWWDWLKHSYPKVGVWYRLHFLKPLQVWMDSKLYHTFGRYRTPCMDFITD